VAREAYHTAVMAPLFIALSLALGLAVFLIVLFIDDCSEKQCSLGEGVLHRPKTLLGVFIGAVFYFVLVYHISHLYFTGRHGVEYFILAGSGIYTVLFWGGYFFLGTILPLLLLYHERFFPGMEVISSGFFDQAKIHSYIPSGWEIMLGMSGIGISALLTVLALRILPFMPSSLADSEIEEAFRC